MWEFTPREICNIAYAMNVRGAQQPMSEDDPSIEDQILEFEESIGQRVNSANRALEQLHEHMRAMGKDPDAAEELPEEVAARIARDNDTGLPDWLREEQEARAAELAFTKGRKKPSANDGWDEEFLWG